MVFLWTPSAAAEGILSTQHNLSSTHLIGRGQTNEVCIYCHTPHHADAALSAQGVPLWNRDIDAGGNPSYTMYSSPTYEATRDSAPSGVSRACLSCHDGTVGVNQLLNNQGSGLGTNPPNSGGGGDFHESGHVLLKTLGGVDLGDLLVDLRDDHPISMRYTTAKSPNGSYATSATNGANDLAGQGNSGFNTQAYILSRGLKLFNGAAAGSDYVQCASCHDPHNAGNPTFLRLANTNSALCLTCHRKDGGTPQ